jgi:crotonobetainyl-CoA:carnitine CoA-transferase CaiB-like acyl-CoA transferase
MRGDGVDNGLLAGLKVVEFSTPHVAFAGRLLADMGADVVVVEPPGGDPSRHRAPVVEGDGLSSSIWWEHYAASKRSVTADLSVVTDREFAERLMRGADVILEGEPPGRLEAWGLGPARWCGEVESLIWTSVTSFGHFDPRSSEPFSDLTILAEGGPVWSCGYDDHSMPPVRGLGNQGFQLGGMFAVMGTLTAVVERSTSGRGQHVDTSLMAAAGVSTELASYYWLVTNETVIRQTGRHATAQVTTEAQVQAADGSWVHTGIGVRNPSAFAAILDWLTELSLLDDFPDTVLLEMGADGEVLSHPHPGADPVAMEIMRAGRDALIFVAGKLSGYDFFLGAQRRNLQCGVVRTPPEVLSDPHLVSRAWPTPVDLPLVDGSVVYPGPWFHSSVAPWRVRPAPRPGQHQAEVVGELDLTEKGGPPL